MRKKLYNFLTNLPKPGLLLGLFFAFLLGGLSARAGGPAFNNLAEDSPTLQVAKPNSDYGTSVSAQGGEMLSLVEDVAAIGFAACAGKPKRTALL